MITNLENVKIYLGITSDSEDAKLNLIISGANAKIEDILDIEDPSAVSYGEDIELIALQYIQKLYGLSLVNSALSSEREDQYTYSINSNIDIDIQLKKDLSGYTEIAHSAIKTDPKPYSYVIWDSTENE